MTRLTSEATRLMVALACLGAITSVSGSAFAWSTRLCPDNPGHRYYFEDDDVWPLAVSRNMPEGGWAHGALEDAIDLWHSIYGAEDVFGIASHGFVYCRAERDAGYGVVSWDDGTCAASVDSEWGPRTNAFVKMWTSDCRIRRIVLWMNSDQPFSRETLRSTLAHELGHYAYYAHNWYEVSIMGYRSHGTPPMPFLSARDHDFLRTVFPSGNVAGPDLHVHRYALLDEIIPDEQSLDYLPEPECSTGCNTLVPGARVSVEVTLGNAGAVGASNVDLVMFLGPHAIGTWVAETPAHSSTTLSFEGVVPEEAEPGVYELEFSVDPWNDIEETSGPTASNSVSFAGFRVICVPDCAGLECGGDGCGGLCGDCDWNEICSAGTCACQPQCSGLECGDDTCGGVCGHCDWNERCASGTCVCEPQCSGRECGDDSCGGVCGDCSSSQRCDGSACICQPDCEGLACGDDGCGGSCGACARGETCEANTCRGGGATADPPDLGRGTTADPDRGTTADPDIPSRTRRDSDRGAGRDSDGGSAGCCAITTSVTDEQTEFGLASGPLEGLWMLTLVAGIVTARRKLRPLDGP